MRRAFDQPRGAGGRFVNLDGSAPAGLGDGAALGGVGSAHRQAPRARRTARRSRAVAPDLARLARPPWPGEPARVTWLGHASFLVQLDGVSLLVDPALRRAIFGGIRAERPARRAASRRSHHRRAARHAQPLRPPRPADAPGACGRRSSRGSGSRAGSGRAASSRPSSAGGGRRLRSGGVRVTFVPAQHWSRRGPSTRTVTLWGGFVIEGSTRDSVSLRRHRLLRRVPGDRASGSRPSTPRSSRSAPTIPAGSCSGSTWTPSRRCRRSRTSARARSSRCTGAPSSSRDEPLDEPPRRARGGAGPPPARAGAGPRPRRGRDARGGAAVAGAVVRGALEPSGRCSPHPLRAVTSAGARPGRACEVPPDASVATRFSRGLLPRSSPASELQSILADGALPRDGSGRGA